MPKTYLTFLIAALAISGIPPLSGFFSKDEILWNAFNQGSLIIYLVALFTAMLTAFYVFRLLFLTFEGKRRYPESIHPHESPSVMVTPLIILAFLSIVGGFVGIPAVFVGEAGNFFASWLYPVFEPALNKSFHYHESSHFLEILLMVLSAALAVCSILLARYIYLKNINPIQVAINKLYFVYNLLLNKYFVDEIYEKIFVTPTKYISEKFFWQFGDVKLIDGFLDGTAGFISLTAKFIRKIQSGVAQFYALIIIIGMAFLLFLFFLS